MASIREYAVNLVLSRLPFCRKCKNHTTDASHQQYYQEVVAAAGFDWQPGSTGSTCGFLCHWLLWSIGVSNYEVVNWPDPTGRSDFWGGNTNISRLYQNGQYPFVNINPANTNTLEAAPDTGGPEPGDIILLQKFDEKD